jgi:hypothetical protein
MSVKILASHALVIISIMVLVVGLTGIFTIIGYTFNKRTPTSTFADELSISAIAVLVSICMLLGFAMWGS